MRIKTQFILTMILFGILLVAISASAIITNQQVQNARAQESIADNVARGAGDLSYFSNDYVIYRESQQFNLWQTRYTSFSNDVADLRPVGPEEQALVGNILANQQRLKDVFDSIAAAVSTSAANQAGAVDPAFLEDSWSRMAVQSQALITDASSLAQLMNDRVDQLQRVNLYFVFAMIAIFLAYFAINYLFVERRTLKSIAGLQAGAEVISSGNLDFKIEEKKNNEVGDLSRAFNLMTSNLKELTASKADLEKEIAKRVAAEESLKTYAQNLEAANKELESFSYTVSHDLRAPLRSMDGYSQALLEDYAGKLDEQGKQWLDSIRDSSQHMGRLIDDILGLSRVIRAELKSQKVDLSQLAASQAARLQEFEPGRNVDFVILPGMEVTGDNNLLGLVLQNLLGNAFKFTSGCADSRIEFGFNQQDGEKVYFVRDNGAGFDMQFKDKLFQPFQRLHSQKEFPGTGIGLVTVQKIIQRHGGKIWAEGQPGKGATFYFTLDRVTQ